MQANHQVEGEAQSPDNLNLVNVKAVLRGPTLMAAGIALWMVRLWIVSDVCLGVVGLIVWVSRDLTKEDEKETRAFAATQGRSYGKLSSCTKE